jgi:hypothetical protein
VNTGWAVLLVAWAVGPLAGFAYFAVTGAVLASVGRALGGSADVSDTRTALACSMLPEVAALPLWIPVLAYYGLAIFTKAQDGWPHGMIAFGVLQALLYLWSLVLRLITLAEVHAFSIGRALGTLLVGWLAGVAMLLALGLALAGVIAVLGR